MSKGLTPDDVLLFARRHIGGDIERVGRIEDFRPLYEVPGRRHDGSIPGRRRVLWLVTTIAVLIRNLLVLTLYSVPLWLLAFPLALIDADLGCAPSVDWFREDEVRGQEDCRALTFADASNYSGLVVPVHWLLESPDRLVLLHEHRRQLTTVWAASGADRPQLRKYGVLQWRDGSTVNLPGFLNVSRPR